MFWKETGKHVHPQRNVVWCVSLAGGPSAHSYGVINIIRIQWALNVETKSSWLHFVACEKPKAREGGNSSELLAELPAEIWTSSVWSPGIISIWFVSKAFWDSRTSAVLDASEIWQYKQGHCPSRRCYEKLPPPGCVSCPNRKLTCEQVKKTSKVEGEAVSWE